MSGVATRRVEGGGQEESQRASSRPPSEGRGANSVRQRPRKVLQRAGKQDDETLDDDDHVARDAGISKASSAPP